MATYIPAPINLEAFLATIHGLFSGPEEPEPGPRKYTKYDLSAYLTKSLNVLSKNYTVNHLLHALQTLDAAQYSLGVSVILVACLRKQASLQNWDSFSNIVILFIHDSNADQIQHAPTIFGEMCHLFADALISRNKSIQGINLLIKAARKIQPNVSALTSVHSDVFKLSLSAQCFGPALDFIKQAEITDVTKESNSSEDAKYILLFFYYGGMILSAVKDFNEALYFFEVCITMPATTVSNIMLEAHKKYLLVHLICKGHKPKAAMNLPKYTSASISKYFKELCEPYNEVVDAFYSNNQAELQLVIARYSDVFMADQNMGLVKQVQKSLTKMVIKRLTKTFLTLSLQELANRVGLQSTNEVEKILVTMIQEGSIHATISQKDGMVSFDTPPTDRYNSAQVLEMLEENVNKCIQLDTKVTQLDQEIALNETYIKKSSRSKKSKSGAGITSGSLGQIMKNLDDASNVAAGLIPRAGVGFKRQTEYLSSDGSEGSDPGDAGN